MSELESFRRIAGDNPFRAWLESQRDESVKYLVNAVDPVAVHRAQGQVQLVEKMLVLLDKAKNLR
jgi:hypothetical protein